MAQTSEITDNIVQTVANYDDSSPDDLPPLGDKVDTETYHKLAALNGQLNEPLEFEYLWYQVTVQSDGEVAITPEKMLTLAAVPCRKHWAATSVGTGNCRAKL